jgi:hypothetical protein
MSEMEIRQYAESRGFHPQTLERWLGWGAAARNALFRLAVDLKVGENHLRDLMDWLEEIALREQLTIEEILASQPIVDFASDPRLGRADKLKRIKEEIRRWRFPRLAQTEDAIRARIHKLKLHPEIRLTVPLGLEGGRLQVELSASSHDEFKKLVIKLADTVTDNTVREIFALLAGHTVQIRSKASHLLKS